MPNAFITSSGSSKENIRPFCAVKPADISFISSPFSSSSAISSSPFHPSSTIRFSAFEKYISDKKKEGRVLSWDPSSSSPESIRSFKFHQQVASRNSAAKEDALSHSPLKVCHICGTEQAEKEPNHCDIKTTNSRISRVLNCLRHLKYSPTALLVEILSSVNISSEISRYRSFFYSGKNIRTLLDIWASEETGKAQILDWINHEGRQLVFSEISKEGDRLCNRFSFNSSSTSPDELLNFELETMSKAVEELAPTFMGLLRSFAIPAGVQYSDDNKTKSKLEKVVSHTSFTLKVEILTIGIRCFLALLRRQYDCDRNEAPF